MTNPEAQKNNEESFFVTRIKALDKSDRIALRRALGSTRAEAHGAALAAFYKLCREDEDKEEVFLAACAVCYTLQYGESRKPFWRCLQDAEVSESRIKTLINIKWVDKDGYFHSKYSRLLRYAVSKGCAPDVNEIHGALTDWRRYRLKFAKEYFVNK